MNQTDLDRRYQEYSTLCFLEGILPVEFAAWLEWDRDVYQPYLKTAATPLSPATYHRLYGIKAMDENNKNGNLTLVATNQDRVTLLEEPLRVTEAELKTRDSRISVLEETVQQYRDSEDANQDMIRSLQLLSADRLGKITALEHALKDVGEANTSLRARLNMSENDRKDQVAAIGKQAAEYLLEITRLKEDLEKAKQECGDLRGRNMALRQKLERLGDDKHTWEEHYGYKRQLDDKDQEISRLKRILKARNRPSLESYSSSIPKNKFAPSFKCLPKDVCVGDILADRHSELKVTEVIEGDNVFHIHFGEDFEVFSSTEFVLLHELTSDGVPYGNLVDKTALEEAKKLIAKLTEQLDQQKISADRKTPANAVKYPHYFREVTNTTHVDVSWFLKAFNIPCCEGHAIKKLLVSGQRGAKNRMQDLKEARDSIDRAIELEEESQ